MARMVKFKAYKEDKDGHGHIFPVYINLDDISEISPYDENYPEYCNIRLRYRIAQSYITLHIDMEHLAELINKGENDADNNN